MGYEYLISEPEDEARKFLKDKGWKVEAPSCPECGGMGTVIKHKSVRLKKGQRTASGAKYTINFWSEPCPNECPVPLHYYACDWEHK